MEETGSPQRSGGPNGYNRLSTLEMEHQPNATATTTEGRGSEPDLTFDFRQSCLDFQQQLESACETIDWDRIFMTLFVTLSLGLILFAFFRYLSTEMVTDQQFRHEFSLESLTISEFDASPAGVTGKCDITLKVTNLGGRSIYHETSVLSIFLDHELLWVTRTNDFFLEAGNKILFNVSINKTAISVPASFVPTAMLESRKFHRPLRFKLKYDGMLREGLAAWYEERSHVYVVCGWLEMQFINGNTLKGGPGNCSIENY